MQKFSKNTSIFLLFLVSSQLSFSKAATKEVDPYAGLETERPYGKRWEGSLTRLERFRAAFYRTFFPTYTEQYLKDVMVSGDTSFDKYDSLGLALKIIGATTVIGFFILLGIARKQANTPGTEIYCMDRIYKLEDQLKEKETELEGYKKIAQERTENRAKIEELKRTTFEEINKIREEIDRIKNNFGVNEKNGNIV